MATKAEIQAELEAVKLERDALKQAKPKAGVRRGKGKTKLQKANAKAGRATNMRYACNGKTSEGQCQAHFYHEKKAKSHVCKFGGKATKITA